MPTHRLGIRHASLRLLSRPLVVLTACIIVAGAGLAWFMVRTVIQERTIAAREIRDAAVAAASRVAEQIVPELERLERDLRVAIADDAGATSATSPKSPTSAPSAVDASGPLKDLGDDTVLLFVRRDGLTTRPAGRLLYDLDPPGPGAEDAAPLGAAETLELRTRDYEGAIKAYRGLLAAATTNASLRLTVQQHLARTLRKTGRAADALVVLEQIIEAHQAENNPAVAAAWYDRCALIEEAGRSQDLETCAVEFYAGLVDGRWRLEQPLYEFYADGARRWTQPLSGRPDVTRLVARESSQLALTGAAQAALRAWRAEARRPTPTGHLVLTDHASPSVLVWRSLGQGEAVLLVLGPAGTTTRIFAPLAARYAPGFAVSMATNRVVVFPFSSGEAGRAAAVQDEATATMEDGPAVWRVTARPDAAHDPRRSVNARSRIYLGTLAVILLSVALAGYVAIRTVRQELEVARLKSEFVSTVSHEFRSPLSAISHLTELLNAGRVQGDERKREYYGLILGESGRLRRLVENLLDFARIEEGRQQYRFESLDVGPWLRRAVDEFQASGAAAGREVVGTIAPDLPTVRADAEAMTTVLENLLDNAVKYSPGSARVWIDAAVNAGDVEIRVRDEGVGIAEADQARVFERFIRGTGSDTVAGTGLGLALARRIVTAHGGTVVVESRVGEGSTFTVRLPASRGEHT